MATITKLKIHPSIGVARIGNHPTEFFTGPEVPNGFIKADEIDGFKTEDAADANILKIKRQGARFRVFAYFDDGTVAELNSDNAEITWRVKIANTKARSEIFHEVEKIPRPHPSRNDFVENEIDRKGLGLEPKEINISGNNGSQVFEKVKFSVKETTGEILSSKEFSLGECKTDEKGRLIVLGGIGNTGSVKKVQLTNYANNDYWYDDIADGYVKASVKIKETGESLEALDAWVLCVPPKYVPQLRTIVTLYDTLLNKHLEDSLIQAEAIPKFYRDIFPIINSANAIPQLQQISGHRTLARLLLPDSLLSHRERLYDRLRQTDGTGGDMPKMFGDKYDTTKRTDRFSLTKHQLEILRSWKDGSVEIDDVLNSEPGTEITPEGLTQAALENCMGGAFYPGIEANWFLRDRYKFVEPFRLDSSQIKPGDITKQMALPWQADFRDCRKEETDEGFVAWWVFARPDEVRFEGATTMHQWVPNNDFKEFEDMVEKWSKLGFIVEKDGKYVEVQRQIPPNPPAV